jgi:ATP-dependent HslUV protease subunit HslV
MLRATTVLAVRQGGQTVMASDGQVTFGDTVVKQSARKICRVGGRFLCPVLSL